MLTGRVCLPPWEHNDDKLYNILLYELGLTQLKLGMTKCHNYHLRCRSITKGYYFGLASRACSNCCKFNKWPFSNVCLSIKSLSGHVLIPPLKAYASTGKHFTVFYRKKSSLCSRWYCDYFASKLRIPKTVL